MSELLTGLLIIFSALQPGPLVDVSARGLSCLHCEHKNARQSAEEITRTLLDSRIKQPAISFLIDGSFGKNPSRVKRLVRRLVAGGRQPTVIVYLMNGASQRRYKTTAFNGYGVRVEPRAFSKRLETSSKYQSSYEAHVRARRGLIQSLTSMGANVIVVPGLEDNLSNKAFDVALTLTQRALDGLPVDFARNPCPGCYSGNGSKIPLNLRAEIHTAKNYFDLHNGIVSNDGEGFLFDFQRPSDSERALSDLEPVRDRARRQNNIFILWTAPYQGLKYVNGKISGVVDPAKRRYAAPTTKERQELVRFLRE